ncbi:MAG: MmgE/PrpD family protein [Silicimonas sp.]|nr:MmgE/PrpD family protein [Silicimonas sp.]
MELARKLADFAIRPARASDAARQMIRLSCLDWAACGMAGRSEPVARLLRDGALSEAGAHEAGVFGGGRVPVRAAALVNGATSHALDYDDTHFGHIGHPSVAVFPAALAMAEREGRSLSAMLDAALIGAEASVRMGLWLGRGHYQVGFHQTATAGAFGATLAAARLAGLTVEQTRHALGLAATKAAGIKAQFGTMGKPLNAGLAAECGVMAVDWAARGVTSNPGALDGVNGFGPTHHGAGDLSAFDAMGEVWQFEDISHKFHACCHGLHAMLEALRGAKAMPERVDIHTHPRWMTVCNIKAPDSGLEAKFSYRMAAAMALSGIDTARIDAFSDDLSERGDLKALMARIHVQADAGLSELQARVVLDDVALEHDLAQTMPFEERQSRLHQKAHALTGRADDLWRAIDGGELGALLDVVFGDPGH